MKSYDIDLSKREIDCEKKKKEQGNRLSYFLFDEAINYREEKGKSTRKQIKILMNNT